MFEATRLVFYYAVSPVHMGAGNAIGAIDSLIQREVHTRHPMFAGAGLKGALRHHFGVAWNERPAAQTVADGASRGDGSLSSNGSDNGSGRRLTERIFGPATDASDYAGALAISDAQLVALPVRSMRQGYAYVTSPLALARLRRLAQVAAIDVAWAVPPQPAEGEALVVDGTPLVASLRPGTPAGDRQSAGASLVLEAFDLHARADPTVSQVADWLASHALGGAPERAGAQAQADFFASKLRRDLVVLNDTDLAHFARHAMVIEPHVRINDATGAADEGGFFYVENLPPESLMAGLAQATVERTPAGALKEARLERLDAEQVLQAVFEGRAPQAGIDGQLMQIGADATSGRGLVQVRGMRGKTR